MYVIKNKYGEIIFQGADLKGADLKGADLEGADLWSTTGEGKRLITFIKGHYTINILDNHIVYGGCTCKTLEQWLQYEGESLDASDKEYLETITKPYLKFIQSTIK